MTAPTRPIMRYHGGKWKLAPWVLQHFPPHTTYTEAFGGAGSVLLRKVASPVEIYNDLDERIVRLFRVLRDSSKAAELIRQLELTPYSRAEHDLSYEATDDDLEHARRVIVRSMFGHGSRGATSAHRTGFRVARRDAFTAPMDWQNYPPALRYVVTRLKAVTVECDDAAKVLKRYDAPDALHFVDPPYVLATRSKGGASAGWQRTYAHEMTDEQHEQLAAELHALQGMVVLCGYPSSMYESLFSNWERRETQTRTDGRILRTEVLWLNPACSNALNNTQRAVI